MPSFSPPWRRSMRRVLMLMALLTAASACTPSRSPAPVYHLLTATAARPMVELDTTIGVGPIRVPPFLESTSVVTHGGGGRLEVSRQHRWSEPLDQAIQRVTLQNLSILTEAKLRNFPWRRRAQPAYAVRLDVLDLDRLSDGTAVLEIIWHLEDMQRDRLVRSRRERFTALLADDEHSSLTTAYSDLLGQLAVRLTTALSTEIGSASDQAGSTQGTLQGRPSVPPQAR